MSEKRHATLDAKATDTYQKRKKVGQLSFILDMSSCIQFKMVGKFYY